MLGFGLDVLGIIFFLIREGLVYRILFEIFLVILYYVGIFFLLLGLDFEINVI